MTTRNRGNYSGLSRRSSSMHLLRQGALVLAMSALSFLLGFFVLARVMPAGHGPDAPGSNAASPPVASHTAAPMETTVTKRIGAEHRAVPTPQTQSSGVVAPTTPLAPAGPSIDPVDNAATQIPASPDDNHSTAPSGSGDAATHSGTPDVNASGSSTHRRRRRTHRRRQPAETPAVPATTPVPAEGVQPPATMDDGTQPAGKPDPPTGEGGNTQGDNNGNN